MDVVLLHYDKTSLFIILQLTDRNNYFLGRFCCNAKEIGKIIRELCRWKGVNLLEAEACPDHIHILVEIPPKFSISNFMGFLKGKSSLMIYEKWGNMKYKYRNRQFWCRGYYVSTVGKNEKKIAEYIKQQLSEDHMAEQLTLEVIDPFGNK